MNQTPLEQIRIHNFANLLAVMRKAGTCSLAQITQGMDVGLTTVHKCVEEGVRCGMILCGETADSTGGRKARQFLLNAQYQYFLMILTDNNDLVCKVYDFNRRLVEEVKKPFAMPSFYTALCETVGAFLKRYPVGTLCLSLPCVVKDGKIIEWYYNPALQGMAIGAALKARFGVHVAVQNGMKLSVLGASARSENAQLQNLVTAQFGHNGIGVGEMVGRTVLEGTAGFAGEVGYIQDVRKDIRSTAYLAKIVRSVIICINPQKIIFYHSARQNRFQKIFEEAVRGLPDYAVPDYAVSDQYLQDIVAGLFCLTDQNGYFKRRDDAD